MDDWQIHKTNLSSRFKELYMHNQWTDCAFRVGEVHTEVGCFTILIYSLIDNKLSCSFIFQDIICQITI